MTLRSCGLCVAMILVFPFVVAAQVSLTITSTPATLTVGHDTIFFPGNISSRTRPTRLAFFTDLSAKRLP